MRRIASRLPVFLALFALSSACSRPAVPESSCAPPKRAARVSDPPQQFIQTSHWAAVNNLAYSDDGRFLASYGADSAVRVWDVEQRHALRIFLVRRDITGLSWDGNSRLLVERQAPLYREHGVLLDVSHGEATATIGDHQPVMPWRGLQSHERWVGHRGQSIAVFDKIGNKRRSIPLPCRTFDPRRFAIAPGGAAITTTECGEPFDTLRIFRRNAAEDTYEEKRVPLPELDGFIRALRISQKGDVVLIDSGKDGSRSGKDAPPIMLVDKDTVTPLDDASKSIRREALLSLDGAWIAARSDHEITVWRTHDRARMWSIETPYASTAAFAPSGREIAVGTNSGRILLFDVASGRALGELGHPVRRAESIRFSEEDRLVVETDRFTNEWTLSDGRLVDRQEKPDTHSHTDPPSMPVRMNSHRRVEPKAPESPPLSAAAEAARSVVPGGITVAPASDDAFLVGDVDGALHVVRHGHIEHSGTSDGLAISKIELSPSGKIAATISLDGAVRIWDAKNATMRVMLYDFEDDEWLAATPRGAYAGTLEVASRIGWVFDKPLEFFAAEQYLRSYHIPHIVRRRLAGESIDVDTLVSRPPRLTIASAPTNAVAANEARVSVSLEDAASARTIRAYAEGRLVDTKPVCGDAKALELAVPLVTGVNRVGIVAFDERGYASNPAWLDIIAEPPKAARPDVWVVAVGVSKYPKFPPDAQLDVADDDAEAISSTFSQLAGPDKPFGNAHVTLLRDEEVTAKSVLGALQSLEKMSANDLAIVSFAGHGAKPAEDADMMFLTGQTGPKKAEVLSTAIGWTAVGDRLAKARGRVVVFLDACHSGHFSREAVVPNASLASALARAERAGVLVFAASKGRQLSYEMAGSRGAFDLEGTPPSPTDAKPAIAGGHGMFTGALLESLRAPSTDRNGDRTLQLSEILDDVARRVTEATDGKQTPWVTRRELFGDFALMPAPR
ncbi:MAG: caspase family protein [Polyangiaceae bacterium]|nr:caspase family protein [Polyangiaceae bacterium]